MISSKVLLEKMHAALESMEKILKDDRLFADVQIDDINSFSWAMVELSMKLVASVRDELSDLEG